MSWTASFLKVLQCFLNYVHTRVAVHAVDGKGLLLCLADGARNLMEGMSTDDGVPPTPTRLRMFHGAGYAPCARNRHSTPGVPNLKIPSPLEEQSFLVDELPG
jgi:hypothetical protein